MSNNQVEEKETNPLQEVTKKVLINAEDCAGAAEFWKHFNVEMLPELRTAFERFEKEPTYENQQEIKLQVCRAIGYTDHEAFRDEMFKEIVEECRGIAYDMSFDKSLTETLTPEDDKTNT